MQLREQLVRRFARSVRTPAQLPGEALPIVSVDSSDASGDDCLHQRIAELNGGFGMYASVYVECHPSWFTYMANEMDLHRRRCVAPLRALPLHPCHGDELPSNIIDVAMCVLHSAQAALQAPLPFHHGAAVILECGSYASILSTTYCTYTCTPCRFRNACITCPSPVAD